MIEREKIEERNKRIREAILVSQFIDTEGGQIFLNELKDVLESSTNQDVRLIKNEADLNYAKGFVAGLDSILSYIDSQKMWASKPMIDEATGEEEILNGKDE